MSKKKGKKKRSKNKNRNQPSSNSTNNVKNVTSSSSSKEMKVETAPTDSSVTSMEDDDINIEFYLIDRVVISSGKVSPKDYNLTLKECESRMCKELTKYMPEKYNNIRLCPLPMTKDPVLWKKKMELTVEEYVKKYVKPGARIKPLALSIFRKEHAYRNIEEEHRAMKKQIAGELEKKLSIRVKSVLGENERIKAEMGKDRTKFEKKISDLKDQLKKMTDEKNRVELNFKKTSQANKIKGKDIKSLEKKITKKENETEEKNRKIQELEVLLEKSKMEIQKLQENNKKMNEKVKKKAKKFTELEKKFESYKAVHEEVMKKDKERFKEEIERRDLEIQSFKEQEKQKKTQIEKEEILKIIDERIKKQGGFSKVQLLQDFEKIKKEFSVLSGEMKSRKVLEVWMNKRIVELGTKFDLNDDVLEWMKKRFEENDFLWKNDETSKKTSGFLENNIKRVDWNKVVL